jgi:hypothetical protein
VRHQLLLNEMSVGIEPVRCMWLGSYLSGRIQKNRIGDAVSKDIKVTSGVPHFASSGLSTKYRKFSITSVYFSTSVDFRTV